MTYGENLARIQEAAQDEDYFISVCRLQDIARELAAECYRLRMSLAMKDERLEEPS